MSARGQPPDVPLVASKKPEFFSWQSKRMQKYIKTTAILYGVSFILGCIYELVKYCWREQKTAKVSPMQGNTSQLIRLLANSYPNQNIDSKKEGHDTMIATDVHIVQDRQDRPQAIGQATGYRTGQTTDYRIGQTYRIDYIISDQVLVTIARSEVNIFQVC